MLQVLDAAALRGWCAAGLSALVAARSEIDDLNVFPVPDGDTGTNLVLTLQAVVDALDAAPAAGRNSLAATVEVISSGSLLGARGNSGVIVSQFLRGLGEELVRRAPVGGVELGHGLCRAADLAYAAVATPVEGTLLTVARAAAEAARAVRGDELVPVARAASEAASEALRRTPGQLSALALAGVVDAGGRGLCVLLDALLGIVEGRTAPAASPAPAPARPARPAHRVGAASGGPAYEVQYLLEADAAAVDRLRQRLAGLGDSLLVVGGDRLWNVHVHVDDVGAALEAGIEAGRPYRVAVTRFDDHPASVPAASAGSRSPGRGIVAVVTGSGLAALFRAEGAQVVDPTASGSAGPSVDALVAALRACGTSEVVLLPNDAAMQSAATEAARAVRGEGLRVAVIPTRSAVQGLSAVAVSSAERELADDVIAMSAAAGATRWAAVVVTDQRAQTSAGVCEPGDVLGVLDDDVAVIGDDVADVAIELLRRMLTGGGELATVVTGADVDPGLGPRVSGAVRRAYNTVECVVYEGGQAAPVLLGVE